MARIRIDFVECLQNCQELGTGEENEMMLSRMSFYINVDGKRVNGLYHADIKQAVGGVFQDVPIEVGPPHNDDSQRYDGPPWNVQAYRDALERAYRQLVGPQGGAIGISSGLMMYNTIGMGYSIEFKAEISD